VSEFRSSGMGGNRRIPGASPCSSISVHSSVTSDLVSPVVWYMSGGLFLAA